MRYFRILGINRAIVSELLDPHTRRCQTLIADVGNNLISDWFLFELTSIYGFVFVVVRFGLSYFLCNSFVLF